MNHQETKTINLFCFAMIGCAALVTLMFGFLAFGTVAAPNEHTAVEVSGTVVKLSRPHPEYGDLAIVLDGQRHYYVNRANEVAYFAWEPLLDEVHPGDTLYLTVVNPLAWRLLNGNQDPQGGPVAGVRTDKHVYMDPQIATTNWTAQTNFSRIACIALGVLIVALLWHPFRQRLPLKPKPAEMRG